MKVNLTNSANNFEELLLKRNILNLDNFLTTSEDYLVDNIAFGQELSEGVLLLKSKLSETSRFLLIIDSDCDGYTSAAIIYTYIKTICPNITIDYLIHDKKQHGLEDHIEYILNTNIPYDLIIIPDASSNDYIYHEQLKEIAPCLILDHHLADPPFSDNAVIINSQFHNYPNSELTGAGVTWKFCLELDKILNHQIAPSLIDLAALGIIGDMGAVNTLENRYIIKHGLEKINNYFFEILLLKQGYSITGISNAEMKDIYKKINPIAVAFYIVPLINALIRVGTLEEKTLLFQAFINGKELIPCNKRGAKGTLEKAAIEVARLCTNARAKQNRLLDNAILQVEQKIFKFDLLSNEILFIILDEEDFPSTLNGLLAMKLSAKYNKPTIVTRVNEDGIARGSIRGLNDSELKSFKELLDNTNLFEYVQGRIGP